MITAPMTLGLATLLLLFGLTNYIGTTLAQNPLIPSLTPQNTMTNDANATNITTTSATGSPPASANATNATKGPPSTAPDTFSANGLICSFVLSTGQPRPSPATGGNATNATTSIPISAESLLPYILGGNWNLTVNEGNATFFTANFTMVHTDGTERHTHQISGFQSGTNNAPLQANGNETALVMGKSNVGTNGTEKWKSVDTTIILDKLSTLSIILDSNATENHFKNQPIYGILNSPISQNSTH